MLRSLVESALLQFQNNQFASGGLVLMVLGGALAMFRSVPRRLWELIQNRFQAKVEVTSDAPAYFWIQHWLTNHPYAAKTRNVHVLTDEASRRRRDYVSFDSTDDQPKSYRLSLGEGEHLFWWRGRPVWVSTSREKNESAATSKAFLYTIVLTSYGLTRKSLEELIDEARKIHDRNTRKLPSVWHSRYDDDWTPQPAVSLRRLDSLVYDDAILASVIDDARRFLQEEARYAQLNIPFRRGYLFHGPPGTGKTSLAMALASSLGWDLCVFPISRPLLDDTTVSTLMATVPPRSVVLFEDIDAVFDGRENLSGNQVTFSGLLNALDGALALEQRITVLTTNRPEVLDSALLRPGRIDVQVEVGLATWGQARELFLRFFPGQDRLAEVFANRVQGSTMAQLQESLIRHLDDAESAAHGTIQEFQT